ncbi:MAG: DUF4411 family protein [Chloroflexota bacterium]|nr:DUF4411 family protein [Chloroflexota bacterium]
MIYILDTNTISQLYRSFYPNQFPTLWSLFHSLVREGRACSVSEVEAELNARSAIQDAIRELKGFNSEFFAPPTAAEQEYLSRILAVSHFRNAIPERSLASGSPVADPYLVAKAGASLEECLVVTEEAADRPNAARVPNMCDYFHIQHTNLEGLMQREGWRF